jgi:hypothetical protein
MKFLTEIFNLQAKYRVNILATSRDILEITERFNRTMSLKLLPVLKTCRDT